jgi:hypothetical protein
VLDGALPVPDALTQQVQHIHDLVDLIKNTPLAPTQKALAAI